MDADRFNRTVIALRVILRHIEELKKRHPGAAAVLENGLGRG